MLAEGLKFAAVDVGSNAMRLLFTRVLDNFNTYYIKEALFRMPLRLGEDAFTTHRISTDKIERLLKTMVAFENLIQAYEPIAFRSCATAALRFAENGAEIVQKINRDTNLNISLISGNEEARLIMTNQIERHLNPLKRYVYIDVGGGSTEVSFILNKQKAFYRSFPIGSVRLLKGQVQETDWEKMKLWIANKKESFGGPTQAIGSGGNINKIFAMLDKPKQKSLHYTEIVNIVDMIEPYNYHERISKLGLRPDRADVITYAGAIYLKAMKYAGAEKMIVPQAGLPDGIIHALYAAYRAE